MLNKYIWGGNMRDGLYSGNPFNLNDMLINNKNLNSYYESLPDYVK